MRCLFHECFFVVFAILISPCTVQPQTTLLRGQLSGWSFVSEKSWSDGQVGLRYIPEFSIEEIVSDKAAVDMEISLNAFGSEKFDSKDSFFDNGKLKAYRLWFRFATSQFEARAGLQKINFGPALLLRPLMWFDRIDPRDPLRLTDGVYGLLLRYTLLNNANVWLWGLYGNDKAKGWEIIPTKDHTIEYGGRMQYPLLTGEIAFSYHHREVDLNEGLLFDTSFTRFSNFSKDNLTENRFALDGTWDIGVGLWFEAVVIHQDLDIFQFQYQNFFMVGTDYTFGLGNGLHVLGEHLLFSLSRNPFGTDEDINLSAMTADYNLGLLDRLRAIIYYNWETEQFLRFASWSRIYDKWSIFVNAFWNPEETVSIGFLSEAQATFGAGKGMQLIVVFNH